MSYKQIGIISVLIFILLLLGIKGISMIEIHTHEMGEWEIVLEATEETEGLKVRKCNTCDYEEKEIILKKIHVCDLELEMIQEPTCITDGVFIERCKSEKCDYEREYIVEASEEFHKFGEWVVIKESTVDEKGIKQKTCIYCNTTKEEEIPLHVHTMTDLTVITPSTCIIEGKALVKCSGCDYTEEVVLSVDNTSHTYSEWEIIKDSTTEELGLKKRQCLDCGNVEEEEIPLHVHTMGEWVILTSSTCVVEGTKVRECTGCGFTEYGVVELNTKIHKFGNWVVEREATTTQPGIRTRYCSLCGYEETEEIALHTHTLSEWVTIQESTCKTQGIKRRCCLYCGYSEDYKKVLDSSNHLYGPWVITDEEGIRVRTCSLCGKEETQTYVNHTHTLTEWEVIKESTCVINGIAQRKCSECNYTEEAQLLLDDTNHSFTDWQIITPVTTTNDGLQMRECIACQLVEEEIIPMHVHTINEWETVTQVTCVSKGVMVGKCETCDYEETITIPIDSDAHVYGDWVIIKEATSTQPGLKQKVCIHCKHTVEEEIPVHVHEFEYKYFVDPNSPNVMIIQEICKDCGYVNREWRDNIDSQN